jgi:membrane-bound lytic murein transglycosylase A
VALGGGADESGVRDFLQTRLQPWRVENTQGQAEGLLTGYFEPLVDAGRQRSERFSVALHAPPADLAQRRPWYTRAQIDSLSAAQAALRGREVAWVADPLDALMLQIQGSGRLVFTESNGSRRTVRLAYAGHNDQPYQSVGRWLVDQGAFTLEQASWPAIRAWARANPSRVREMMAANPRYVFFREEPLPDPEVGALGAQGVPLTPGRSIAVDRESIPYGSPVWMDSTEPQPWQLNPPPARPMRRLVVAQDTGSAIVGAVRADLFWGWGEGIEDRAGRTKQPLRLWVLWPR